MPDNQDGPFSPVKSRGILTNKSNPIDSAVQADRYLDVVGTLARNILGATMLMPKNYGPGQETELQPAEVLVTRAFDAAELFYREAHSREHLVDIPTPEQVEAANCAAKRAA